jgi:NAD(P)-dependent dehydrogenase (short-subunit alcohol dehydrogenase family)/putative sterol carrier protein
LHQYHDVVCTTVEEAGGQCLPCTVDIRDEKTIKTAVEEAVKKYGGIDIVVNNASAISLTGTLETSMKRFDLMMSVNARGTFATTQACLPYLKTGKNPHILNISPPLNMKPVWFKGHVAYTMAKYGMSMCVLGMAEEFKKDNIGVNALWPRTAIETAAMKMLGGEEGLKNCRKPEIMADAAYCIVTRDSKSVTGNFFVDDEVLKEAGVTNFDSYASAPGHDLLADFFLDEAEGIFPSMLTSQPTQSSTKGSPATIFNTISSLITEDTVKSIGASFMFDLQGEDAGKFYLDLRKGTGSGGAGELPSGEPADATLTVDAGEFYKMITGESDATMLYMSGKLKIGGNLGVVMKLQPFLSQLKSKL